MRSHYKREARAIAKKGTRRWYLTQVLIGKAYRSFWASPSNVGFDYVEDVLTFVLGPHAFLNRIDTFHPDSETDSENDPELV